MLIIPIKDGENIDRALKRFKRKFDKTGGMRQLRARKQFIKPSVRNRQKIQKAQYIQQLRESESRSNFFTTFLTTLFLEFLKFIE